MNEWATKGAITTHGYKRTQKGKAKGLLIDCAQYTVPNEPIWQGDYEPVIRQPVLKKEF